MKSLKEWAVIIGALEDGQQTVLLRKGGIMETASGFNIEATKFLLFPTKEHQGSLNIKEQFQNRLKSPDMVTEQNDNRITSYAEILAEKDVTSTETLDKLSGFHIWSRSYIDERMRWKAERPIKALFLKVYKIPEVIVPLKPEYQGCKSWIDIDGEIPEGKQVLTDAEIKSRLKEFEEITN